MEIGKKLVLATKNSGKQREIAHLLSHLDIEVVSIVDIGDIPDVDEDQPTLEGNAEKKARVIYDILGLPTLADDTGLEVEALDGRPGVYSARYAGKDANPDANRALLLNELSGKSNRSAQFRTVLALVVEGELLLFEGVCKGEIIQDERGVGGFGYDPVFVPEGRTQTFAEMSMDDKNKISHRGRALEKLVLYLSGQKERSKGV